MLVGMYIGRYLPSGPVHRMLLMFSCCWRCVFVCLAYRLIT